MNICEHHSFSVLFTKNKLFCLAKCICMTVENKNVRYIKLKELIIILKTQQYSKLVVEEGIRKALAVPQE